MLARSFLADCGGVDERDALIAVIADELDTLDDGDARGDRTAGVVDDLLHQFCTAGSSLIAFGDEIVDLTVVGEAMTFTHRLTEQELADERLDLSADLAVLARIAQADGGLHLPDATPLVLQRRQHHGAGRGVTILVTRSLTGPPGWLSAYAAGGVIAASATDGYLTIEAVDPADLTDTETFAADLHDDLQAAFGVAAHGDDAPVFAEELQAAWLLQGWAGLDRHTPPFGEIVTAAGLEVDGADIGRPGIWAAHARLARTIMGIRRHVDHLEQPESAALSGFVRAFDAWREDSAELPDPAILDRLRAHADAAMCLEEELVRADPDGHELTAFLGVFDPEQITVRGRPVFDGLQSLAAEVRGDGSAADGFVDSTLTAEPRWFPALDRRIRFLELRGEVQEALRLLQHTRVPDDRELLTMRERVAEAYPTAGRNEPCPCGSGRKFKQCHLGRDALTPTMRVSWLLDKARNHVSVFDPALVEDLGRSNIDDAVDDGDDGQDGLDKVSLVELDMVLFECGGLDRFLRARRELLPAEEVRLVEGWVTGHRASVFRVEGTDGDRVVVTDQRNGEQLRAHPTPGWSGWSADDLVWCRLLPDGDSWWSSGVIRAITLQHRTVFLAASESDPSTHFHTVLGDQAIRRNPPLAPDGHPLVRAFTTWALPGDRDAIEAVIDAVADRSEHNVRVDETGWIVTDQNGSAAQLYLGEQVTLEPEIEDAPPVEAPWHLVAHANSVSRQRAVEALVAERLPDAALASSRAKPFARAMEEEREDRLDAYLEKEGGDEVWDEDDDWGEDAAGGLHDQGAEAGQQELVETYAKLTASAEEAWCTTAVPELGNRSPLEAIADPALLPDVRTLLRDMERNAAMKSPDRLRSRLGLDKA